MPFHRYDGPFRWLSPPSLRVILHREGRLPFATAAGDLNYTGSTLGMRWLQVMLERGVACVEVFVGFKSAVSLSTALSPRGATCALSMKRAWL